MRSHLVYECKRSILEVYDLNKLEQADIAVEVGKLLDRDRFIYRIDGREVTPLSYIRFPPHQYIGCMLSP